MRILLVLFMALLLTSCGGAGKLPTDNITLGEAFHHVASTGSYWGWLIGIVLAAAAVIFVMIRKQAEGRSVGIIAFVCVALVAIAIFMRPCEVAANTTVEQAARGHYLGY